MLIDFSGQKIFNTATVDTNILMVKKNDYKKNTKTCIVKEKWKESLSKYVSLNSSFNTFPSENNWVVLSSIESTIKEKIQENGVPLKDWDIKIYRGILTGYNEAFIIDGNKRRNSLQKIPNLPKLLDRFYAAEI